MALVALCILTAAVLEWRGLSGVPAYYFYGQDAALLMLSAAALMVLSHLTLGPVRHVRLSRVQVIALTALAAAFAYAGTWFVMLRYPMSRDEMLALFAAEYFQRGMLGWPIPTGLRAVSRAMMTVGSDQWLQSGYWVSGYLPVNSAFFALAGAAGDAWLAGPVLLAIGIAGLWSSARRLWPDTTEPACVALILALTSTQVIVTAMTPYAMTAQFALHALWLACFLRGGRWGHAAAIGIGLLASGLHQFHFHLIFLSGFIVWCWLADRRKVAAMYAIACIGYQLVWHHGYLHLMTGTLGSIDLGPSAPPQSARWIVDHLERLTSLEPFSSLARFAAWQNILLVPLAVLGIVRFRRRGDTPPGIALAFQLSCLFGLATMVYQGRGYGYRYLHGLMPCFLLLAAGGWMRLRRRNMTRFPRGLLTISAGFALCVTLPFALWQSHALLRPYAVAYGMARTAPADIVLVDSRGGGFLQDIVRIDHVIARPLILDLAYVPVPTLRRICAQRTVMLFDARQAGAAGIMGSGTGDDVRYPAWAAANRRRLAALHCDMPVPIRSTN